MELKDYQEKITFILQQKYGVKDVEFGLLKDGKWENCPYIGFNLNTTGDIKNLDLIFPVFQRRILGRNIKGAVNDHRDYLTIHIDHLAEKGDLYRRAVAVIKSPKEKNEHLINILAKEFYQSLDEGIGLIRFQRALSRHSVHHQETAKTRTIAKSGYLQRNRNNSYWKI